MKRRSVLFAAVFALCFVVGCGGGNAKSDVGKKKKEDDPHAGHNHGAAHDKGHIVEIVKDEVKARWFHDNKTGLITFYLLDWKEKELRTSANEITITTQVKDKKRREFKLPAMNAEGTPPKANKFEVTDKILLEALKIAGDGIDVELVVDVNGKTAKAKLVH